MINKISELFKEYQDTVANGYTKSSLVKTYGNREHLSSFPSFIEYDTILPYSKKAALLVMLIANLDRLRFFDNINYPVNDFSVEELPLEGISDYLCELLHNPDFQECWTTMLRLCTFDWASLEYQGELPRVKEATYRHIIDGIRSFTTHACLHRCVKRNPDITYDVDDLFLKGLSNGWTWLKGIYHQVVRVSNEETSYEVSLIEEDTVAVNGKPLSKNYLQLFYSQMVKRYDNFTGDLHKYFSNVKSAKDVGAEMVFFKNSIFHESRSNNNKSLLGLWSPLVRKSMIPKRQSNTEDNTTAILDNLSEMGTCLMWMLFLALGGPNRYPELAVLKYAGNDRNLFIDPKTHCVDIIFRYSKYKCCKKMIKRLDRTTSCYVMHYIAICRRIMKNGLGKDYDKANRDLFGSANDEDNMYSSFWSTYESDKTTDKGFSTTVLKSFLFFDPRVHHLLSRGHFTPYTQKFPDIEGVTKGSHLTLRELRQGIVGLTRHFIDPQDMLRKAFEVKEEGPGHSVQTSVTRYGVSTAMMLGNETTINNMCEVSLCETWQTWLNLDALFGNENCLIKVEKKQLVTTGGPRFLKSTATDMCGNGFVFHDEQDVIACEIWSGTDWIIPVQALPGYGKTVLFEIPVAALKRENPSRKVVSMVFVPYMCLVADMVDRLNGDGLVAVSLLDMGVEGRIPAAHELTADVLVCSYKDITMDTVLTMINDWDYLYPQIYLGYVVIDEVHNIGYQEYRQNVTKTFRETDWKTAHKLILLSSMIGFNRFSNHLA